MAQSMLVDSATPSVPDGHTNGDVDMVDGQREGVMRFAASGIILPPPEIKCEHAFRYLFQQNWTEYLFHILFPAVIDRTALFVARSINPPQFEDKIREGQRSDPKFSFLNPADPYHAYYRNRMDKIAMGELGDEAVGDKGEKGDAPDGADTGAALDIVLEPPPPEFIIDLPHISSIDLCVLSTLSFSFFDSIL